MTPASVAEEAWQEHRIWSRAADKAKSEYHGWRLVVLVLAISGAASETLASQLTATGFDLAQRILAFAGAAMIGLIPLVAAWRLKPAQLRAWVRARSASEGLKSRVYEHLTGLDEFSAPTLSGSLGRIQTAMEDLAPVRATAEADDKLFPAVDSVPTYLEARVREQIERYYEPKSAEHARAASRLKIAQFILSAVAVVLGAAAGLTDAETVSAWVAVVTTAGTAVGSHLAAARHELLTVTYLATSNRLKGLVRDFSAIDAPTRADELRLVNDCESAISVENQAWMAEWLGRGQGG
jgi:hypothetical protein